MEKMRQDKSGRRKCDANAMLLGEIMEQFG